MNRGGVVSRRATADATVRSLVGSTVVAAGVLTAAIRMMQQALRRPSRATGMPRGSRAEVIGDALADAQPTAMRE
jgi:chloramphenicol 3-O-phosphotransferase